MGAKRWPRFNIGPERLGVIRQYVVAMCASVSGVLCGSAFVWLTPLMPRLLGPHSEVPMTEEELSWTVSIIGIGDLVTPIPAGMLADRLGRKPVLLLSGPAYLAAWLVIAFTRSVPGLYVARLMQGMALGISYTVLPIYLGEIASADIRGRLGIFVQYSWYIGIIFEYSIGPFLSYDRIVWTSLSLTIAFVVMFIWCPESPHFLAMRGRDADAANSLTWLRGGADVSQEMATIREGVENSKATDPASGECCSGGAWQELLATKKGLAALGLGLAPDTIVFFYLPETKGKTFEEIQKGL